MTKISIPNAGNPLLISVWRSIFPHHIQLDEWSILDRYYREKMRIAPVDCHVQPMRKDESPPSRLPVDSLATGKNSPAPSGPAAPPQVQDPLWPPQREVSPATPQQGMDNECNLAPDGQSLSAPGDLSVQIAFYAPLDHRKLLAPRVPPALYPLRIVFRHAWSRVLQPAEIFPPLAYRELPAPLSILSGFGSRQVSPPAPSPRRVS